MGAFNRFVAAILRSPVHPILSRSTALIRYHGRRTGRIHVTPVQYARHEDGVVIFAGNPWQKTWWRNFELARELDVLIRGEWVTMLGRAHIGTDDPAAVRPLLNSYLARFPKATRVLGGASESEWVREAVVVECRRSPTSPPMTSRSASASKGV